jgi:pimeloyl-ACP methyl ester carboxylesterase
VRTLRAGSLFVYEWGSRNDPAVLYWDGLGGSGLHANELAPILVADHGLRVVAPDPPGHGRSAALPADAYRPSRLADVAARLLDELGVERVHFVGFSWGGRVGCSFAALFPEHTASLALVEGGIFLSQGPADFTACVAEAQKESGEESFATWEAFFAYERESLRRWSPAVAEAHEAVMREQDGMVVPIVDVETLAAITYGGRLEPVTETYPTIAANGVRVLLIYAPRPSTEEPVERFRTALPAAGVEAIPDAIHDLISFAPDQVARLVGELVTAQPPPLERRSH